MMMAKTIKTMAVSDIATLPRLRAGRSTADRSPRSLLVRAVFRFGVRKPAAIIALSAVDCQLSFVFCPLSFVHGPSALGEVVRVGANRLDRETETKDRRQRTEGGRQRSIILAL
jgi:hypothetical protein